MLPEGKIKYQFKASIWQHESPSGWYFVSVPKAISDEIRTHLKWQEEGWGRMKASAQVRGLQWDTAIWFDTNKETYILPIKAEIRKKANLNINIELEIFLWV